MSVKLTNQEIYDRLYGAISERRLSPGTKLSEERLARAFHASRTRIREVLLRLSQELIVEQHLNRGAFVASPTREDLRHVFEVRRALERAIAADLADRFSGQVIASLRAHLDAEARARAAADRAALAQLTGLFHVRLAEATGNRLFSDNLRRLVALTGLVIAQYDTHGISACPDHEHRDIVRAIEGGDARRAERLMLRHLDHVQQGIRPSEPEAGEIDFERILGVGGVQIPEPERRRRGAATAHAATIRRRVPAAGRR
jgi:DNA-binding GntR family transcriptional regulator